MIVSIANLSAEQLRRAASIKNQIQSLESRLERILGDGNSIRGDGAPREQRKMSVAGRARIIAAQKARWAKVKGKKQSAKPAKQAKRKLSAAAKAKISAAAKARWAKAKAQGKKSL